MGNAIIMMVLKSYVAIDISATLCPDKSQWSLRADSLCNKSFPAYFCLFDDNKKIYKEFCETEPDAQTPGHQFVIRGGLDIKLCDNSHYQPFKLTTNGYSQCMFEKTKCIEEGQMQYDNGTTTSNRLCRCDYSSSYNFIKKTRRLCYCDPTEEDCSCYKKMCPDGYVMSPDYVCIDLKRFSGNSHCPEIKRYEIHREREDNDYNDMVSKQFKDISHTRQSPITRLPHIVISCVIVIVGLMSVVVFSIKYKTNKLCLYKIRLLKNYDRIVKEIVPMETLSKMPYFMISEGDRCDVMDMVTQNKQSRALLNILINSDESIYNAFLVALREDDVYKDLAKVIEMTPVNANETVGMFNTLMKESVPLYARRRHDKLIKDWREEIETKESKTVLNLYSNILTENVIAMIGTSGCGKSLDLHSVALMFLELDFDVIPCTKPSEFIDYHNPDRCQIFLFEVDEKDKDDFLKELNEKSEKIRSMHMQRKEDIKQKIVISISCDTCWLNQKKEIYPNISFFVDKCLIYP